MTITLYLASTSPRRKEILEKAAIPFTVIKNQLDDERLPSTGILLYKIRTISKKKAYASKHNYKGLILSADTLVCLNDLILGKPTSLKDAINMLELLSGKTHKIITGFTLLNTLTQTCITRTVTSKMSFNILSKNDIETYVNEKQPLDKAGSYGIQEIPAHFIASRQGDYNNIVGLPINNILKILRNYDIV